MLTAPFACILLARNAPLSLVIAPPCERRDKILKGKKDAKVKCSTRVIMRLNKGFVTLNLG